MEPLTAELSSLCLSSSSVCIYTYMSLLLKLTLEGDSFLICVFFHLVRKFKHTFLRNDDDLDFFVYRGYLHFLPPLQHYRQYKHHNLQVKDTIKMALHSIQD